MEGGEAACTILVAIKTWRTLAHYTIFGFSVHLGINHHCSISFPHFMSSLIEVCHHYRLDYIPPSLSETVLNFEQCLY
jgi:hypothetical protein